MRILILIILLSPVLVFADDPHHETTVNNYSVNNITETNGQAALFAADQIHPSENISGLQLGFGAAQHKNYYGLAAGAAFNVKGWGMINGSIAKEPDIEPFVGIGIKLEHQAMKDGLINACKRLKVLWDTYKIVKAIIIFLGLIGVGSVSYLATDDSDQVLVEITQQPEYALKDHTHQLPVQIIIDHTPAIKQAIDEHDKKHDPQKLGH